MLEKATKILYLYLPFQLALNPAEGVDLASIRILIPILFILWLAKSLRHKKLTLPNDLISLFALSFLFMSAFSLFFAQNQYWGVRKVLFLFSIFPIFFIIKQEFSTSSDKISSLLKYFVWGSFLSATLGIFQFFLQFLVPLPKLYKSWSALVTPFLGNSLSGAVLENPSWLVNIGGKTIMRATSLFPDPHMFSFYLNISSLICLGFYLYQRKKHYLIFFLSIGFCNLLTFSRGGYLGFVFGLLFFAYFLAKNKSILNFTKKTKIITILSVSLLITGIIIFPNNFSNRFFSIFDLSEGSNSERLINWKQSLEIIKNNPVFGVGIGNYSLSVKPSADYREPIYSHNTFLDIAAESGIISLFFWIFTFVFSIKNFYQIFKYTGDFRYLGLSSSLVSFMTHSAFDTAIYSVHILTIIVMILALNQKYDKIS